MYSKNTFLDTLREVFSTAFVADSVFMYIVSAPTANPNLDPEFSGHLFESIMLRILPL